jgi:hypothetical protein
MDLNQKVKEALGRTEFMALSTSGPDGVWTNPVAHKYDAELNLYWMSMMHSKHSQNILSNPKVSAAIFKTERFPGEAGDVMGLQLAGTAVHLTDPAEIEEASRACGAAPSDDVWHFFKITPTELWLFDSRDFGEERVQVNLDGLDLS